MEWSSGLCVEGELGMAGPVTPATCIFRVPFTPHLIHRLAGLLLDAQVQQWLHTCSHKTGGQAVQRLVTPAVALGNHHLRGGRQRRWRSDVWEHTSGMTCACGFSRHELTLMGAACSSVVPTDPPNTSPRTFCLGLMAESSVAMALRASALSEGGAMITTPSLRVSSSTTSCGSYMGGGRQAHKQWAQPVPRGCLGAECRCSKKA